MLVNNSDLSNTEITVNRLTIVGQIVRPVSVSVRDP